jgi:hypothetical protein
MKAVLIACLIALAVTAEVKPKRDIMKVFAQVEAHMKNGGPLDIIADVLGEFERDAVAEQAAHDSLRSRSTSECNSEFEYRSKQVADAVGALKQATTTLTGCQDQQNRATADLTFTRKVLGETETMIRILDGSRQAEIAAFNEYAEAYEFNSAQMDEAVELVAAVISGQASMIQLVKHSQKMLRNSVKLGATEKFGTMMSIFAQLGNAETDNEFLEQLSNVVTRLRSEIEEDWQAKQAQELKDQEEYESLHATTTEQLETLRNTESELETLLANLNRCIIQETGNVASATAKRDQHQRLWDEAAAYCATVETQYTTSTQERRDELDLLDTLRARVTQRWGDFEDIERDRVKRERERKTL